MRTELTKNERLREIAREYELGLLFVQPKEKVVSKSEIRRTHKAIGNVRAKAKLDLISAYRSYLNLRRKMWRHNREFPQECSFQELKEYYSMYRYYKMVVDEAKQNLKACQSIYHGWR